MTGPLSAAGHPEPTSGQLPSDPYPVRLPVVALVGSAGGLDALIRVISPLPADLAASVLVLLHQSPDRPSQLTPILRRHTALVVDTAADGTVLRAGQLLVIPPGQHLIVTAESRIGLIDSDQVPPARPSADLLLTSLAATCGRRALAVVLSGLGHDGQAGVRAIAHCGGSALAQDAATAKFHSMPAAAIATHQVRQILPVDEIAAAICRHVTAA